MSIKFHVEVAPGCISTSSDWDTSEIYRIEIDPDGRLTIYATDDSTHTYLWDEWLSLTNKVQ